MLKEVLQGKPFHHPLHPLLVHFPIGLFMLSVVLDLINLIGEPSNLLLRGSFYTLLFALGMATTAAVTGFADWTDIREDHPARRTAMVHMALNLIAIGLFAVSAGLRYATLDSATLPLLPLLLSLAGAGVVMISGYLGGVLVYDDGISVGRHRRQSETPERTISVSSQGSDDGFAAVAPSTRLAEGQTLRAAVDGSVMALVRLGGQVYAFQDFCTHRYGPLSEGTFENGQVMCPWHRSCFDVRTGKVTQGPAKVDLNVYEVEERNGVIHARVRRQEDPLRERFAGAE